MKYNTRLWSIFEIALTKNVIPKYCRHIQDPESGCEHWCGICKAYSWGDWRSSSSSARAGCRRESVSWAFWHKQMECGNVSSIGILCCAKMSWKLLQDVVVAQAWISLKHRICSIRQHLLVKQSVNACQKNLIKLERRVLQHRLLASRITESVCSSHTQHW